MAQYFSKLFKDNKLVKDISIVIPVFNEAENLERLHTQLLHVCNSNNYDFEIILVDDGSTDNTKDIIDKLSPIKYVRLRKNFGQTAALDAGIKNAKNTYIITMDGDLQNDPEDIPHLINYLEKNELDVVSGWRKKRKDRFFKRFASRVANLLRIILIKDGIHDSGCTLKIYKKQCFEEVSIFGEMHRFIPAVLKIKGYNVGEIPVNHRPRTTGKSKYNWKRSIKGLIDMISVWFWSKYAVRPLHLLGGLGFLFVFLGGICVIVSVYQFSIGVSMSDTAYPLLAVFLILAGMQLFVSGLIADVSSKHYYQTTKDKSYNIKDIIEH